MTHHHLHLAPVIGAVGLVILAVLLPFIAFLVGILVIGLVRTL